MPVEVVGIDPFSGDTLTQQVYAGLRLLIERGAYAPGEVLPSRATLARRLGVEYEGTGPLEGVS